MTDAPHGSEADDPPASRLIFTSEWSEDRLITVEVHINEDGSEGWGASFAAGLTFDRRGELLREAAALLADAKLSDEPPPRTTGD